MSLNIALNKGNKFHDIYAHLTKHIVLFYLIVNFFNDRKRFVILTWVLILSASLFSIGGIIYFYIISGNNWGTRLGLPEVGIGVNYLGFFTITAILFSLTHFAKEDNLPRKTASIFCVIASSMATILTATKGTFLGLIFPLFLLLPRYKKPVTAFALFFLVIVSFAPVKQIINPESMEERKKILYIYFEVIKDHPIAGIGYGMQTYNKNFIDEYNLKIPPELKIKSCHAPHNTFIDVTVRLGVVGLALFLYILFIYGRMGWRLIRRGRNDFIKTWALCLTAALVSFLIQGMFADLLLGVQILIFFILMAMMTILWRLNQEQKDPVSITS
jgi:O-antigen ligase